MRQEPISGPPTAADLEPTERFDFHEPTVAAFARRAAGDAEDEATRASRLFAAVREQIRYAPSGELHDPAAFAASAVLRTPQNWCVPKALLLAASARAVGIPARLGFADVRNHLSSPRLTARMGTDLFVYHGYTLLFVEGAWRKASPAFNAALCARFGTPALDFDGRTDALLHAHDGEGRRHMEYVTDHGAFADVPFERMWAAFAEHYDMARLTRSDGGEDALFGGGGDDGTDIGATVI
ncbi:MAG: transglutaminase [Solirubrobacterales bacterium]|nr:transglutaminase [Solirubrobacterales bacterium]